MVTIRYDLRLAVVRRRFAVVAPVVALCGLLAFGCKDSRRLPPQQWRAVPGPVKVGDVVLDEKAEPGAVATALLDLLKQCRDVRGRGLGDPERAAEFEAIRNQIYRLAAAETIFATAAADPHHLMPRKLTAEKAVEIVTNNWPAVVGYYIDGVARDTVIQKIEETTHAQVTVRAVSPRDRAVVDRIARSLADQRDSRGDPLKPDSEAYNEAFKRPAIAEGVCPPIETKIVLSLVRESDYWRVAGIRLERAASTARLSGTDPKGNGTTRSAIPSG